MRLLITAGPTREFFDSVRFISNPSSGRMGYSLAEAGRDRGHEIVLVSGPVALAPPEGVEFVSVTSAEEMFEACKRAFDGCAAAIMTAAVCDYRPTDRMSQKLAKSTQPRRITLEPTPDIAAYLGSIKGGRVVIGFAMEDHDHRRHAEAKLARKGCDAIVLNGPENVGSRDARVEILTAGGTWSEPIIGSKREVADRVVQLAEQLVGETR